jgi:hypothetical protein
LALRAAGDFAHEIEEFWFLTELIKGFYFVVFCEGRFSSVWSSRSKREPLEISVRKYAEPPKTTRIRRAKSNSKKFFIIQKLSKLLRMKNKKARFVFVPRGPTMSSAKDDRWMAFKAIG